MNITRSDRESLSCPAHVAVRYSSPVSGEHSPVSVSLLLRDLFTR